MKNSWVITWFKNIDMETQLLQILKSVMWALTRLFVFPHKMAHQHAINTSNNIPQVLNSEFFLLQDWWPYQNLSAQSVLLFSHT